MTEHKTSSNQIKKVELPSSIEQVLWTKHYASTGALVGLEVFTKFVGNNSDIQIELYDKNAKKFDTIKRKISGDHVWLEIAVPEKAKDELYAYAKLPKHNLCKKSQCLYIYPPAQIKNCKWDKKEARRGDILKLTADVLNVYEGTKAEIQIWEHDDDGVHDFITKFPAVVKNKKIEAKWEFEYHEDTDDIPTEEEAEKGYNPPEYFFKVIVAGVSEDSGLLEFKDWIEIKLEDEFGEPLSNAKFCIKLSDDSEIEGQLDKEGYALVKDVKPGPYWIYFPDFDHEFEY